MTNAFAGTFSSLQELTAEREPSAWLGGRANVGVGSDVATAWSTGETWVLGCSCSDGSIGIAARCFGIAPENEDNADGFVALTSWIMFATTDLAPYTRQPTILFEPGDYLVSEVVMDLTQRTAHVGNVTPRFSFRGSGAVVTTIRATSDSSAPVLFSILAGYAGFGVIEDMAFIASSTIRQDALGFYATKRTYGDGGASHVTLERVEVRSALGDAMVFVGGEDYYGPMQFISFIDSRVSANVGSALKTYGQFGQIVSRNVDFSAESGSRSASVSVQLQADRRTCVAPTDVDLVANCYVHAPPNDFYQELTTGTPVRIIGTGLPSGLATGTTYYVRKYGLAGNAGGVLDKYTLHATQDDVGTGVAVAFINKGTLGTWYVSPLYAINVAASTITTEFPHNLVTEAEVRLVGSNLPTGLSSSTPYFVIRDDAISFRLASSAANAYAGIALPFSGGSITSWGLTRAPIGTLNSTTGAYSVDFQVTTIQNCLSGLYVGFCDDVRCHLHIENVQNSIHVYQSSLSIVGGHYANPADNDGNGVLLAIAGHLSRVSVDAAPYILGVNDFTLFRESGAYYSKNGWATNIDGITSPMSRGALAPVEVVSNVVDVKGYDFVTLQPSVKTFVDNIKSQHGPRAQLKFLVNDKVVFRTTGNILFPGATLQPPQNSVVTFESIDGVATWILISTTT